MGGWFRQSVWRDEIQMIRKGNEKKNGKLIYTLLMGCIEYY
jgi:hypothetical protein